MPPQLSGFVCAFQPTTPGLSPKHTSYAFIQSHIRIVLYLSLHCDKNKNKQKEARLGPLFFKKIQIQIVRVKGKHAYQQTTAPVVTKFKFFYRCLLCTFLNMGLFHAFVLSLGLNHRATGCNMEMNPLSYGRPHIIWIKLVSVGPLQ